MVCVQALKRDKIAAQKGHHSAFYLLIIQIYQDMKNLSKEQKIKYLKQKGWHPVWTENMWSDTECSDMGGIPLDEAYKIASKKEANNLLSKLSI